MSLLVEPPVLSKVPEARHLVLPHGIVSTGYPAVSATCGRVGIYFDPWQVGLAKCILAKACDGEYAADTVVFSIARQVGKTFLIGAICFADCIINPGTTVIWTAHRFKVARETFDLLKALAQLPAMFKHIDPSPVGGGISSSHGDESITFRNGSRVLFAARERGSIRGISKVRRLVMDEAQILAESVLADLLPTMNQAENPQVILMGTPPKPKDDSAIFVNYRDEALAAFEAGEDTDGVMYVELSADPDADLDDWDQVKKANPSLDIRTPRKAIRRLRRGLADDDYRREALGIWDDVRGIWVIDKLTWQSIKDEEAFAVGEVAYGIDVSPDREFASIGMAGWTQDGRRLVEFVEGRNSPDWIVSVAKKIDAENNPRAWVIDAASPAANKAQELEEAGLNVIITGARQYANACQTVYDEAYDGTLVHLNQPSLNLALGAASKRDIGAEGAWAWNRKKAESNITPLVSVSLATEGLTTPIKTREPGTLYGF